jgi:hypothetical protein
LRLRFSAPTSGPIRSASSSTLQRPQAGKSWPGRDWLPIQVVCLPGGGLAVDWVHFAGAPLDDPFFATDARRAAALPFNRLFRYRIGLDHLIEGALDDGPAPDGFIFHMSRCGSTLVSQMLAALPGVVALAEPAPLDIALKLAAEGVGAEARGGAPEAERGLAALRAMVAALGRRRSDDDRHLVFKLDSCRRCCFPCFAAPLHPCHGSFSIETRSRSSPR